jgi:hypothetical protein
LSVSSRTDTIDIMPLFDAPVSRRLLWPLAAPWPRRRARQLIGEFQNEFPKLVFDVNLEVEIANAQAFLDGKKKRVRLYGGLARHRKIGSAGLSFALAHETGHHLGGPPHLPYYHWLSSEERATEWALTIGLPRVFGRRHQSIAQRGLDELRALRLVE